MYSNAQNLCYKCIFDSLQRKLLIKDKSGARNTKLNYMKSVYSRKHVNYK